MTMPIGFFFDMHRCSGCRACQVACKDKNRLDVGTVFRRAKSYCVGEFPHVKCYSYSASCNHCENPACVLNCPTGAMRKASDGAVLHDDEMCIGCATCVKECPYEVPTMLPSGLSGKCDSCVLLRKLGGNPVCVDACPNRALDFGDIEDLKECYGDELVSSIAPLPSVDLTNPHVLICAKDAAHDSGFVVINW